jgi:hypothetical protein
MPRVGAGPSALEPLDQDRVLAAVAEVGEQDGDRLAHDPATVGRHPVLAAERVSRALSSAMSSSAEM